MRCSKGYSLIENDYDLQGNITAEFYFDESPEPVASPAPDTAGQERPYVRKSFGVIRRRALHTAGYAGWRARYDERGFMNFKEYFDRDNSRMLLPDGYAAWVSENEERGKMVRCLYLDRNREPVRIKQGYAAWTATYDKFGDRIEKTYRDQDDNVVRNSEGFATVISSHDWRGNEIEMTYLDEAGKPARHRDGFLKCESSYNDANTVVAKSFSGFDESTGPFEVRTKYDSQGREIEQRFFDDGWAGLGFIHHAEGYEYVTKSYDDQGNLIETRYEGYVGPGTVARRCTTLNPSQRLTEDVYLNAANEPVMGLGGFAKQVIKRDDGGNRIYSIEDESGNVLEVGCFDAANIRVAHVEGWAYWIATYDALGRSGEAYYGTDLKPVLLPAGYAAWKIERDSEGHKKDLVFTDTAGQPVKGPVELHKGTANA